MKKYVLALDLVDDPQLIKQYQEYHHNVWPEIRDSIRESGILNMEIFLASNRLAMLIEATDDFSFERKKQMDDGNEIVQRWEELMWKFQSPLPFAKEGEKWVLMTPIFELENRS